MHKLLPTIAIALWLLGATPEANAGVCANDRDLGACSSISSCESELQRNSSQTSARLALCELHVSAGDLDKARQVLKDGLERCSGRRCAGLRLADSNVREKQQRETQQVSAPTDTSSRDRAYCSGPIANTRSIDACKKLLKANNNDVAIAEMLASKLLKTRRPTQAVTILAGRSNLTASGSALLADARQQHDVQVTRCLEGNSIDNCNAVLLAGDSSEYRIQRKRGQLLSNARKPEEALKALQQSVQLRPNDRDAAAAISALNPGDFSVSNAGYFESLAAAQRVLGNATGEAAALKRLLAVRPDNQAAQARLVRLEPAPVKNVQPTPESVRKEPPLATIAAVADTVKAEPIAKPVVVAQEPESKESTPVAKLLFANAMDSAGRSH